MTNRIGRPSSCFYRMPPGLTALVHELGLTLRQCRVLFCWTFSQPTLYNITSSHATTLESIELILNSLISYAGEHNFPETETKLRGLLDSVRSQRQ